MRRVWLAGVLLLLAGCSWFREPPQAGITTGATVVYNGGPGGELFSLCNQGNLIYLTKSQPAVAIVKDGCNPSANDVTLAQLAAIQRLADRPPSPPFTLPSPLPVQIVPGPGAEPRAQSEPREPVVVVTPACPACPVWTPSPAPTPLPAQSKAAPKAPAPKVVVVPQLDPNTASADDLERLPGVTAKAAQAVVRGRPYRTLHELVEKKALTEAELAALAPYLAIR